MLYNVWKVAESEVDSHFTLDIHIVPEAHIRCFTQGVYHVVICTQFFC